MSKRTVLTGLAILVVVGFISLRHYYSPGEVVKRKFIATIEAFEEERLLAVMSGISRGYSDPWGLNYEILAGYLNETMETYEDLDVDSLISKPVVGEGEVRIDIQFVVWGRYEGRQHHRSLYRNSAVAGRENRLALRLDRRTRHSRTAPSTGFKTQGLVLSS